MTVNEEANKATTQLSNLKECLVWTDTKWDALFFKKFIENNLIHEKDSVEIIANTTDFCHTVRFLMHEEDVDRNVRLIDQEQITYYSKKRKIIKRGAIAMSEIMSGLLAEEIARKNDEELMNDEQTESLVVMLARHKSEIIDLQANCKHETVTGWEETRDVLGRPMGMLRACKFCGKVIDRSTLVSSVMKVKR